MKQYNKNISDVIEKVDKLKKNRLFAVATALAVFGGVGDLLNPIQNISDFGYSTLAVNKAEYLVLSCVWSYLAVMAVVAVIYLLLTVFRNRKIFFIGMGAFTLTEYLLYANIESQSIFKAFK